ncbi:MAG TPA: rod shape-determining protein MreD [Balneolaceae bacterium]|nr:rod shape-determining protein MreD [Balneolaceae bacterium]
MNKQSVIRVALGIIAVILQAVLFRHLSVLGMHPDFVLLFLLWYMTKGSRTTAILMAAFLGFMQDALLDLWGLNMFAKTLIAFIAQPWIYENMKNRREFPRIITVVFLATLAHNLIFLILSSLSKAYSAEVLFWRHFIGDTIYTTIVAGIIQIIRNQVTDYL